VSGVLYPDAGAIVIRRLIECLALRSEPFASDVFVANMRGAGNGNAVSIVEAPLGGTSDTITTFSVRVNVYSKDEAECADLANLVRAILAGTAPEGAVDGADLVGSAINTGPSPINDAPDGWYQRYMLVVFRLRGRNL
jgi:hypothetical protein